MELIITYTDSEGDKSNRKLSDIEPYGEKNDGISAFCHLRNASREFKLARIQEAIDPSTGESIENIWKHLGMSEDENGNEKIISLVTPILPAIKALKYFCLQERMKRGFAVKERQKIISFIRTKVKIPQERHEELDEWLKKIWVGDMYEEPDPVYLEHLIAIPTHLKSDCRIAALDIAAGSRRKPIEEKVLERIDREFPGR